MPSLGSTVYERMLIAQMQRAAEQRAARQQQKLQDKESARHAFDELSRANQSYEAAEQAKFDRDLRVAELYGRISAAQGGDKLEATEGLRSPRAREQAELGYESAKLERMSDEARRKHEFNLWKMRKSEDYDRQRLIEEGRGERASMGGANRLEQVKERNKGLIEAARIRGNATIRARQVGGQDDFEKSVKQISSVLGQNAKLYSNPVGSEEDRARGRKYANMADMWAMQVAAARRQGRPVEDAYKAMEDQFGDEWKDLALDITQR